MTAYRSEGETWRLGDLETWGRGDFGTPLQHGDPVTSNQQPVIPLRSATRVEDPVVVCGNFALSYYKIVLNKQQATRNENQAIPPPLKSKLRRARLSEGPLRGNL